MGRRRGLRLRPAGPPSCCRRVAPRSLDGGSDEFRAAATSAVPGSSRVLRAAYTRLPKDGSKSRDSPRGRRRQTTSRPMPPPRESPHSRGEGALGTPREIIPANSPGGNTRRRSYISMADHSSTCCESTSRVLRAAYTRRRTDASGWCDHRGSLFRSREDEGAPPFPTPSATRALAGRPPQDLLASTPVQGGALPAAC